MNKEYWKESISQIFNNYGLNVGCDSVMDEIVENIMTTAELEGQYTGTENIPNPMQSEVHEYKKQLKTQEEYYENMLRGITKGVAKRRGVEENKIHINDNGYVTYDLD